MLLPGNCCPAGVVANITVAVCSKSSKYYWAWYCTQKNVARSLFTAVLPPLLLMLWQSMVMPNVLYRFAWVSCCYCCNTSFRASECTLIHPMNPSSPPPLIMNLRPPSFCARMENVNQLCKSVLSYLLHCLIVPPGIGSWCMTLIKGWTASGMPTSTKVWLV